MCADCMRIVTLNCVYTSRHPAVVALIRGSGGESPAYLSLTVSDNNVEQPVGVDLVPRFLLQDTDITPSTNKFGVV